MQFPRALVCAAMVLLMSAPAARAHRLEPIDTHFAQPFEPRAGSLETTYGYERRSDEGLRTDFIPDAEFELGIARRMQFSVEMPLVREKRAGEPATLSGGHLGIGFRYLLAGGREKTYAVSINPSVAAPTGNRHLLGDATEAGLALHFDKKFGRERAFFHGNYGWSSTIGGRATPERLFLYRSALVVPVTRHWNPAFELLGQTNTATGRTELVAQPEIIYYASPHWELKLAVPAGLTGSSPTVGVRAQLAWIFGRKGSD